MIEEYKKFSEICENTDYSNKQSVKKHNKAVNGMYKIIEKVAQKGQSSVDKISQLLDDKISRKWVAFQLLEKVQVTSDIELKCLSIIEDIASGDGAEAMGSRIWLDEWKAKKDM